MSTPAGWYADPSDSRALRWWSGLAWTDHIAAAQPPAPAYGMPQPYTLHGQHGIGAQGVGPAAGYFPDPTTMKRGAREKQLRRVNPVAYAGLLVALIGMIVTVWGFAEIAAIILSSIGLARAGKLRSLGHLITGRGYSIAGLVIGIVALVVQLALIGVGIVNSPGFLAGFQAGLNGR